MRVSANGFLLGIDIGGSKVAMATATPQGRRLESVRLPTAAEEGADAVLARVLDAAGALATSTRTAGAGDLLGLGVVCPGVIGETGVLLAPNNPGWDRIALRSTVASAFPGAGVHVMNDVKAAGLAEATHGRLAGVRSGIFLNVGTGLAAAIVVNGTVLDGAHGAAGEIGYQLPWAGGEHAPSVADVPVFTDGRAPLEELFSGRAIRERVSARLGRPVSTAEAFSLVPDYPDIAALIDEAVTTFAVHIANLAVVLDPERVVLGGGLMRQADLIVSRLTSTLDRVVPFPPQVVLTSLPDDAGLAGALVVAAAALAPASPVSRPGPGAGLQPVPGSLS